MSLDTERLFNGGRTIVDVRSPAEYAAGHIPGAVSLPLFQDAERAAVGTAYVQEGRERAVHVGLGFVGPKLQELADVARGLNAPLALYCWRGGMRSSSVAWLFQTCGMDVWVVPKGYKAYRSWVHSVLSMPWKYHVIGGRTGSGKTEYLRSLAAEGNQVVDLEALANHFGSAFGGIGQAAQPSTEQFMNNIAQVMKVFDVDKPVYVEDESRTIGTVYLPEVMYASMQRAPITVLDVDTDTRIRNLLQNYAHAKNEDLVDAFQRIERKLGGEQTRRAVSAVTQQNKEEAIRIALAYYDKTYDYCLSIRNKHNKE